MVYKRYEEFREIHKKQEEQYKEVRKNIDEQNKTAESDKQKWTIWKLKNANLKEWNQKQELACSARNV